MEKLKEQSQIYVNEQEKMNKHLLEENRRLAQFKSIADYSNNWETFRDLSNQVVYSSPSIVNIIGYTPQEYMDGIPSLEDLVHPDDLQESKAIFGRLMAGESVQGYVFRVFNKKGEIVWLEGSAQPVKSESGNFIGIRISNKDITKYKKLEEALKASEARYKLISDFSADWEVYRDVSGKMVYCSPAVERIMGYTVDEFIEEMPFDKYIHADDVKRAHSDLSKIFNTHQVHCDTYRFICKDGSVIYMEVTARAVFAEGGVCHGFRLSGRDVTDKIRLERELRKLNAAKDKFFSIISHDLRMPFNALLWFSELLLDNSRILSEEEKEDYISIIHDTSRNTLNLLEKLLTWARSQSGDIEIKLRRIDLKSLLEEVFLLELTVAQKKNIKIISRVTDDVDVFADADMLNTIMRNLISNAIKFTGDSGSITIDASQNGKFIEVSITDTGVGMSQKVLQSLFSLGETHSSVGTDHEIGTGLGLVLCKEFVEKQGGQLWAESELGKGSVFKFTIPTYVA